MAYFTRNIIICEIKTPTKQPQKICYSPELIYFRKFIKTLAPHLTTERLKKKLLLINDWQKQYGVGIIPTNLAKAKQFIENLYNELLKNNIALPPVLGEGDLRFTIEKFEKHSKYFIAHELKIKIQRDHLTFFARYMPFIGTLITFTLTLGLTITSLITLFGWGWSLCLFSIFGVSKFLTSYADISGGPERRLRGLGLWLDRILSQQYSHATKLSIPRLALTFSVIATLACSSLLTWFGAWQMIRCMNGMTYFPDIIASTLAGLFAWSSASASFGRIYDELYDLIFHYASSFISFDHFKDEEKINVKEIFKLCKETSEKREKNQFSYLPQAHSYFAKHLSSKKSNPSPVPSSTSSKQRHFYPS